MSLQDCVHLLGSMSPEQVREHMEKANIYLFTSDFNEGRGAVLNESMNSGCAVVASHVVGSVPFLIRNGENGMIYPYGDMDRLYDCVEQLMKNPEKQWEMVRQVYETLHEQWNVTVAAERLLKLAEQIKDHGSCDLFDSCPCSRADTLSNDWFC